MRGGTAGLEFSVGRGRVQGRGAGEVYEVWQGEWDVLLGGMQSSEGIGFGIFGDVVLKAQFVVFDVGGGRMGFGRKRLVR